LSCNTQRGGKNQTNDQKPLKNQQKLIRARWGRVHRSHLMEKETAFPPSASSKEKPVFLGGPPSPPPPVL